MLAAIAKSFGIDLERIDTPADGVPRGLADHKTPEQIQALVDDWLNLHELEHALWISHAVQCSECAGPFVTKMKERLTREGF